MLKSNYTLEVVITVRRVFNYKAERPDSLRTWLKLYARDLSRKYINRVNFIVQTLCVSCAITLSFVIARRILQWVASYSSVVYAGG